MNKKRRLIRFTCFVTFICIFVTMFCPVYANENTLIIINETEPNNTYIGADQTYDDYDNFGKISSPSDVDWWTITFTSEGIANFWLGKIPSGCNYDLQVFKSNGTTIIVESLKASNAQELCKVHVRSGETYYIKIDSASGSSNTNYKMRVKNYPLGNANIFTTNQGINTTGDATVFLPVVWDLGYGGQEYLNNSAADFYSQLPLSDILVASNHGDPGLAHFYNSNLYGFSFAGILPQDRALSNFSSGSLSNAKLVIYSSCKSGLPDSTFGNLVDQTISKGAFCCIGWKKTITSRSAEEWLHVFMLYIGMGKNIGNARSLTNDWVNDHSTYTASEKSAITQQYCGSSRLFATKLG